uniref:Uncharacterized protein n=1 Tax=Corvus moneduloides TaxID=1196302 RepID=A0A8C3DN90_CORMO
MEIPLSCSAELTCPICLGLYRDPVSLNCGHSFCRQCIKNMLGAQQHSQGPYTCPMCRVHLGPTVELQNNFQLGNIVEAFQASASKRQEDEGSEKGKTRVVPCEYCLDGFQEAVKTCVVCNVSLYMNCKLTSSPKLHIRIAGLPSRSGMCGTVAISPAPQTAIHCCLSFCQVKLPDTMTELQDSKSDLDTALEELQKCENQVKVGIQIMTNSEHLSFTVSRQ